MFKSQSRAFATFVLAIAAASGLVGCSGTGAGPAPDSPSASAPPTTSQEAASPSETAPAPPSPSAAPTPSEEAASPSATGGEEGCPDTVFATFADLADLAAAKPEPIAAALGVTLPSAPMCTISWTDGAGDPSFTMFWPGADYRETADALGRALIDAGFHTVKGADPFTPIYVSDTVSDLTAAAREPGSKLSAAVGHQPTAVMYGPNPSGAGS